MSDSSQDESQKFNANKVKSLYSFSDFPEWVRSLLEYISSLGTKYERLLKGTYTEPKRPDLSEIPEGFFEKFPPTDTKDIDEFNKKYWSFFAIVLQYNKEWNNYLRESFEWEEINDEIVHIINSSLSAAYLVLFGNECDAYRKVCQISEYCHGLMNEQLVIKINTYLEDEVYSKLLEKPFKDASS